MALIVNSFLKERLLDIDRDTPRHTPNALGDSKLLISQCVRGGPGPFILTPSPEEYLL